MIYDGIRVYCGDIRWYTVCTLVIYDGIRLYCDGIRLVYDWYTIGIRLVYDWYTIALYMDHGLQHGLHKFGNNPKLFLENHMDLFLHRFIHKEAITIKWKTCLSKHFSYHFQLLDCPKCAPQPDCISFPKTKHFIS